MSGPADSPRPRAGAWKIVLGLTLLALLLAAIPYFRALGLQTEDRRFMGLLGGVDDNNVYLSLMRQAREGSWLFVNEFTPEPSRPALFNPLYLTLGRVARYTGLPLIAVHHLFGALSTLFLAATAYRFFGRAFHDTRFKVAGTAMALFASGFFGVTDLLRLLFGWDLTSVDSWLAELSAFHCVLIYPHFLFASALLILTVEGVARALTEDSFKSALLSAVAGTILLFSHAFDLATALGTVGLFTLALFLRDGFRGAGRRLYLLGVFALPVASGAVLTRIMLDSEPVWSEAVRRLEFPAPEPIKLLLGTGLTGLLALIFFVQGEQGPHPRLTEPRSFRVLLARCWIFAVLLLLYNPMISWQFHVVNGIQVPLALLVLDGLRRRAVIGRPALRWLVQRSTRLAKPTRVTPLVLLALCTVASLSVPNHLRWYWQAAETDDRLYLSRSDLEAVKWIESHAARGEVVLADPQTAHFIPRLTGNRVVAGEDILTTDYRERATRVRSFYGAVGETGRLSLLREFDVRWVFYGANEQRFEGRDLSAETFLQLAFQKQGSAVFRVLPAD